MYKEFHVITGGEFQGHIACRPEPIDCCVGWVRAVVLNGHMQPIRMGKAQEIQARFIGDSRTAYEVAFHGKTPEQIAREDRA